MTNNDRPLRHASLFSGIGGPEIAASMLGWDNVFHCEINPFGRRVLEYWFPESDSYEDITKTDFRKYRGHVDVLSGGFPCQPFSLAGNRRGADDDRYLWPEMLRVIDEVRPSWVVGENVAGIITMVEPGETVDMGCEATLFGEGDGVHRYMHRGASPLSGSARILSRRDIPSSRCLFRLVPSELHTEGTGSSLLPTVIATDIGSGRINKTQSPNATPRPSIAAMAKTGLLPTPTVMEDRRKPNGDARRTGKIMGNLNPYSISKLLPTPRAVEVVESAEAKAKRLKDRTANSMPNLSSMAKFHQELLPTPLAGNHYGGCKIGSARRLRKVEQKRTLELNDLAVSKQLSTPTARDWKPTCSPHAMVRKNNALRTDALSNLPTMLGERHSQRGGKTSQLSPLFVEEMMGFPLMWTTLPFLLQDGG